MLNDFLESLRQKEIQEQVDIKRSDSPLKFHFDIQMNTRIARYLRDNFDVVEYTTHFYDCETYDDVTPISWQEKMQFNNWIDVLGPGIWGFSLEETNKDAFEEMLNEIKRKYWEKKHCNNDHRWHIFLYDDLIFLHWFGRDVSDYWGNDKWWIYEPKDKTDMIDFLYFCYYDYEMRGNQNEKY